MREAGGYRPLGLRYSRPGLHSHRVREQRAVPRLKSSCGQR